MKKILFGIIIFITLVLSNMSCVYGYFDKSKIILEDVLERKNTVSTGTIDVTIGDYTLSIPDYYTEIKSQSWNDLTSIVYEIDGNDTTVLTLLYGEGEFLTEEEIQLYSALSDHIDIIGNKMPIVKTGTIVNVEIITKEQKNGLFLDGLTDADNEYFICDMAIISNTIYDKMLMLIFMQSIKEKNNYLNDFDTIVNDIF